MRKLQHVEPRCFTCSSSTTEASWPESEKNAPSLEEKLNRSEFQPSVLPSYDLHIHCINDSDCCAFHCVVKQASTEKFVHYACERSIILWINQRCLSDLHLCEEAYHRKKPSQAEQATIRCEMQAQSAEIVVSTNVDCVAVQSCGPRIVTSLTRNGPGSFNNFPCLQVDAPATAQLTL